MAGAAPATSSSRYDTILKLASGGMATVWIGTVRGALGFRQLVAIKKPHPHLLGDERFRSEIVAEARLASMIHHANVVDVRDVEIDGDSISLVMDYIEGASLGELIIAAAATGKPLPARVAVRIAVDTLAGLHAAHELVDERDRPVGLVHRDVSPQNILVGVDGIARVADFGVAKFARKNMASTSDGSLKGKLAYMAPEYLRGEAIDRRFDVFALGVVLWEALTGERCFRRTNEAETLQALLSHEPAPISQMAPELGTALDGILACALAKARDDRFQNAAAMAAALESTAGAAQLIAGHVEVAATVKALAGRAIDERRALVRAKLANEPSVASLLGVPAIAKDLAKPIPVRTAPMVEPMAKGPLAVPDTQVAVPRTLMVASAVPSTQPMTPRMDDAPAPPAPALPPQIRTLPSEAGAGLAVPPAIARANATHPSAGAVAIPPAPSPSAPTLDLPAEYTDTDPRSAAGMPPRRAWLLPVILFASLTLAGIGLWVSRTQAPSASSAPPVVHAVTSEPAASATAPPPPSSAAPATSLPRAILGAFHGGPALGAHRRARHARHAHHAPRTPRRHASPSCRTTGHGVGDRPETTGESVRDGQLMARGRYARRMKRVVVVALALAAGASIALACSSFTSDAAPSAAEGGPGEASIAPPDDAARAEAAPIADAGPAFCSTVDAQFCWSFDEGMQPLTGPFLTLATIPPSLSDASLTPPAAMQATLSGAGSTGVLLDVKPMVSKLRCEIAVRFQDVVSQPSESITVLQLDYVGSFFTAPRISAVKQDATTMRLTAYHAPGTPADLGNVPIGSWVHLSLESEVLDGGPWITRASVAENALGELAVDGGARDTLVHFDKVLFGLGALSQVTWHVQYDNVVCTWH